ncbi:alpha/beta hydrolase family protein [Brevundimonas vesicularis]|uniref:alpha/beta hydrolase family protein n=1 Tax=Brevundimonas vesicularis TaxID=41276 RepID=UPI0038D498DC
MKKQLLGTMIAACVAAVPLSAAMAAVMQEGVAEAPPASAFGRKPAISGVSISPDGQHVVAITSPDGKQRVITIWKTDDLRATPHVVGSDPRSEIISVRFIKKDRLAVTTQQLADFTIGGTAERSYRMRTQILDLEGNPIRHSLRFDGLTPEQQAFVGVGSVVSNLPRDSEAILVRDPIKGDLYRLNLYSGRFERLERGSDRFSGQMTDLNGEVRARQQFDFDNGAAYIGQWIKDADGNWAEHFRSYARDRTPISIVGFTLDPNIVLVSRVDGRDHEAIYEYNVAQKQFGEIAFAHPVFDADGVLFSRAPEDFGEILGFSYQGERSRVFYVDPVLDAAQTQIRQALGIRDVPVEWKDIATGQAMRLQVGEEADVDLVSVSEDRSRFIVRKSGGAVPPEYYVLQDGRLALLGRAYPELRDAPLGPVSLIQYEARDGLLIPGILTKPDPEKFGPGPYPAIITPHGGPWARDDLDWDPTGWTQYFAARGFAVLQPQFRGSMGWGQRLWRAGDSEWGRKMQDDNDDGARYLIAQGIAAPDRIAMHGYSYGGYASMMAAVRPNGLYQCAIAGAGPATIDLFKKGTYNSRYLREFQHPTANGEDPLRRLNEISIPLYLYTGDRDTRVIPQESRTLAAAMERAGKPVQLRILPDMEHTMNTWTPENVEIVLTSIEEFLKKDCGPGGI